VQGVGFREFVRREAQARALTGFVRNSDDERSVEVVAEGEESSLNILLDLLREGPRFARVEHVDFTLEDATLGFSAFSVEL
jgi:acylphosphatase